MKVKFSTCAILIVLAVGITIRLLTGSIWDLFPGAWYRYIWPISLIVLATIAFLKAGDWLGQIRDHFKSRKPKA